jgi:pimeloyl-ACP methyl ester carboxylesterase
MGMRPWVEATTRMTRLPDDADPDLFRWYVDEFLTGDPDIQVALSKLVNAANASEALPRVVAPVLGLYPTSGQITDKEQERMLRERLGRFTMVHLPTAFHMVHLMFPAACARHVLAFCAAHDGITPSED